LLADIRKLRISTEKRDVCRQTDLRRLWRQMFCCCKS